LQVKADKAKAEKAEADKVEADNKYQAKAANKNQAKANNKQGLLRDSAVVELVTIEQKMEALKIWKDLLANLHESLSAVSAAHKGGGIKGN
jgi:hypothetical protein